MDDFLLIDEEPKKWLTAFQSLAIMLAFFVLLVWSSNWNIHKPRIFIPAAVFAGSLPPPLPEAKPKKDTKTINKDIKTFDDAEIALKKQEEEQKEKERKKKELDEKKRKEKERKEEDRKKKELDEKKRKEKERKEKERKEKELADKKRDEEAARQQQRLADEAAARAAELATLEGIYIGRIVGRLKHFVDGVPNSVPLSERNESTVATFSLKLTPDGYLEDLPYLEESSGYEDFDASAERAILRALPLPMPKDPELLERFLNMTIRIDAAGQIN